MDQGYITPASNISLGGGDNSSPPAAINVGDRFLAFAQSAFDLYWIVSPNGEIREASESWKQFTGQTSEDISGKGWVAAIYPADRPLLEDLMQQSMLSGQSSIAECLVRRFDGIYRSILVRSVPVRGADNAVVESIICGNDITEQKRDSLLSKEQAQPSHTLNQMGEWQLADRRASMILDSISDAVFCVDREWNIIYVNARAEEISRRSREGMAGKIIWDIAPEVVGTIFEQKCREAMETQKTLSFEAFYPLLQIWMDIYVYPSKDGLSIYFHNVSERKQTERALRDSEAKFRRLVESNIIGVMIVDKEGRVCETNDAFLQLVGYTRAEFEAQPLHWVQLSVPEFEVRDLQAVQELHETGVCQPYEKDFLKRDGTRVPVLLAGASLDTTTVDRWFAFVVDITARKEIEKQKDIFISVVGHELRTPLAGIKGNLQLLRRRVNRYREKHATLSEELTELLVDLDNRLGRSLRQIGIQSRLINDILDVSRIAVDKLELSLAPCNLVKIVLDVVEDFRLSEPSREFVLEPGMSDLAIVTADQDRIAQVLSNYLTNAIKYADPETQIRVGITPAKDRVRVWVQDFGPGLLEDDRVRIWGRFYQLKDRQPEGSSAVGLGLGLYICENLITRHHGSVGVESDFGHGSTFWFELPVQQEA